MQVKLVKFLMQSAIRRVHLSFECCRAISVLKVFRLMIWSFVAGNVTICSLKFHLINYIYLILVSSFFFDIF